MCHENDRLDRSFQLLWTSIFLRIKQKIDKRLNTVTLLHFTLLQSSKRTLKTLVKTLQSLTLGPLGEGKRCGGDWRFGGSSPTCLRGHRRLRKPKRSEGTYGAPSLCEASGTLGDEVSEARGKVHQNLNLPTCRTLLQRWWFVRFSYLRGMF